LGFLSAAAASEADLHLFSEKYSAQKNRLAIIERFNEWIQESGPNACSFTFYEGTAAPIFFLRWFLGANLESKMHYAECSDGGNSTSHILIEVSSPSRAKQKFTVGMRSITRPEDTWPYYSESTYASKGSFIESVEENQFSKTIYSVHYKYRNEPAETESGEIQHPVDLPNIVHTYASLMAHIRGLIHSNDTFNFVMTDPYSAAIQDQMVKYPMWRNNPLQVIKTKRNEGNSVSMRGWFPYAFGQLNANIDLCFGESRLPDLIRYRHPFMNVDLWRSSGVSLNQCKIARDKDQAKKRKSRFRRPKMGTENLTGPDR
jgi:hypothetical protein